MRLALLVVDFTTDVPSYSIGNNKEKAQAYLASLKLKHQKN